MTFTLTPTASRWLCLSQIIGRTPRFWLSLLCQLNFSVDEFFTQDRENLIKIGLKPSEVEQILNSSRLVQRVEHWLAEHSTRSVLYIGGQHYPKSLTQLDSPPLVLFCWGHTQYLSAFQIAIVGSRKATLQGLAITKELARSLGVLGITVTSGLALGIDGAAHQGALATQGRTLAVLGSGLSQIHPKTHSALAREIAKEGCLVSEFAPWVVPRPYHFPRRNRIIAALAKGVLIVEAKIQSGSLITANLAAELGREVFAIPGSIKNSLSEGPHWLIQQGAKLTTCIEDITLEFTSEQLPLQRSTSEHIEAPPLSEIQQKILNAMCSESMSADELMIVVNTELSELMAELIELELNGFIVMSAGGYAKRGLGV